MKNKKPIRKGLGGTYDVLKEIATLALRGKSNLFQCVP